MVKRPGITWTLSSRRVSMNLKPINAKKQGENYLQLNICYKTSVLYFYKMTSIWLISLFKFID